MLKSTLYRVLGFELTTSWYQSSFINTRPGPLGICYLKIFLCFDDDYVGQTSVQSRVTNYDSAPILNSVWNLFFCASISFRGSHFNNYFPHTTFFISHDFKIVISITQLKKLNLYNKVLQDYFYRESMV